MKIFTEKIWKFYTTGNTSCSDVSSNLIISTQAYSEAECKVFASKHRDAQFLFWSNVIKKENKWHKSRCDLFRECNLKRSNDAPGNLYKLQACRFYNI